MTCRIKFSSPLVLESKIRQAQNVTELGENSIQSQQQQVFQFSSRSFVQAAAKPWWIPVTEVCHLWLEEQAFSGWTSVMVFFEARNHDT
jgi:hypothetical protein